MEHLPEMSIWFWNRLKEIVYPPYLVDLYFENNCVYIETQTDKRVSIRSIRKAEKTHNIVKIPYEIFFSEKNLQQWFDEEETRKKEKSEKQRKEHRNEEKEQQEIITREQRKKRYLELQQERERQRKEQEKEIEKRRKDAEKGQRKRQYIELQKEFGDNNDNDNS